MVENIRRDIQNAFPMLELLILWIWNELVQQKTIFPMKN